MGCSSCSLRADVISRSGQLTEFHLYTHAQTPTSVMKWWNVFVLRTDEHGFMLVRVFKNVSNRIIRYFRWMVLIWTSQQSGPQESWWLSLWLTWRLSLFTLWLSLPSPVHWHWLPVMGKPLDPMNFKRWRRVCGNAHLGATMTASADL